MEHDKETRIDSFGAQKIRAAAKYLTFDEIEKSFPKKLVKLYYKLINKI